MVRQRTVAVQTGPILPTNDQSIAYYVGPQIGSLVVAPLNKRISISHQSRFIITERKWLFFLKKEHILCTYAYLKAGLFIAHPTVPYF
jgi:hypothetical protein